MNLKDKINAFSALGAFLCDFSTGRKKEGLMEKKLDEALTRAYQSNPWFTENQVKAALHYIGLQLNTESLEQWIQPYKTVLAGQETFKRVGIVMAGNIPAVGFHDLLCVLMAGHRAIVKLSSKDHFLIPFLSDFLISQNDEFSAMIEYTDRPLTGFDGIIATGSNNTSRYFESYFSELPHIIRKNRNSVAVLDGHENQEDLASLCEDIFLYFGLGCRSVSCLFVPQGYSFDSLLKASEAYTDYASHHKYASNYLYYKTIFIMNNVRFTDNGILMLKHEDDYASPVSVVYYSEYSDAGKLNERLINDRDQLQCIISNVKEISGGQPFGSSQHPSLADYADGIDTMAFLGEMTNFGH